MRWGVLAASGTAAFYAIVVAGAPGSSDHLVDQVRTDGAEQGAVACVAH